MTLNVRSNIWFCGEIYESTVFKYLSELFKWVIELTDSNNFKIHFILMS